MPKPKIKRGKKVKAWAVTQERGRMFTPHVCQYAFSVFKKQKWAKDFLIKEVHKDHKAKIIPITITYTLKSK